MGAIREPQPVKLFVGLLSALPETFPRAASRLAGLYGKIDLESEVFDFDLTDYYEPEMGSGIKRKFVSFEALIGPEQIAPIKVATNELESELAEEVEAAVPRPLNLDPGYLEASKLILATAKNYSHRIYLREGIYAEVTLQFQRGRFTPLSWTYPDYKTEGYLTFFAEVRAKYMAQLRASPDMRQEDT